MTTLSMSILATFDQELIRIKQSSEITWAHLMSAANIKNVAIYSRHKFNSWRSRKQWQRKLIVSLEFLQDLGVSWIMYAPGYWPSTLHWTHLTKHSQLLHWNGPKRGSFSILLSQIHQERHQNNQNQEQESMLTNLFCIWTSPWP